MAAPHGAMICCIMQLLAELIATIVAVGTAILGAYVMSLSWSDMHAQPEVHPQHNRTLCHDAHPALPRPARWVAKQRRSYLKMKTAKFFKEVCAGDREYALVQGLHQTTQAGQCSSNSEDSRIGGAARSLRPSPPVLHDDVLQHLARPIQMDISTRWDIPWRQTCAPVAGDGNCFWRAISVHLHGDQHQWAAVKNYVLRNAINTGKDLSLGSSISKKYRRVIRGHVQALQRKGWWADHWAIFFTAVAFNISIHVQQGCKRWTFSMPSSRRGIALRLHRHHFEPALVPWQFDTAIGKQARPRLWGGQTSISRKVSAGEDGEPVLDRWQEDYMSTYVNHATAFVNQARDDQLMTKSDAHVNQAADKESVSTRLKAAWFVSPQCITMEQMQLQGGAGRRRGQPACSQSQADGDVREVWLCSPTQENCVTVSVMRDNYTWRQAFQQAIFGWNFHVGAGTDWHTLIAHLARALKIKAAALVLYRDEERVDLDGTDVTETETLRLKVDRALLGNLGRGEAGPDDGCSPTQPVGSSATSSTAPPPSQRRMRSRTPRRPSQVEAEQAADFRRPSPKHRPQSGRSREVSAQPEPVDQPLPGLIPRDQRRLILRAPSVFQSPPAAQRQLIQVETDVQVRVVLEIEEGTSVRDHDDMFRGAMWLSRQGVGVEHIVHEGDVLHLHQEAVLPIAQQHHGLFGGGAAGPHEVESPYYDEALAKLMKTVPPVAAKPALRSVLKATPKLSAKIVKAADGEPTRKLFMEAQEKLVMQLRGMDSSSLVDSEPKTNQSNGSGRGAQRRHVSLPPPRDRDRGHNLRGSVSSAGKGKGNVDAPMSLKRRPRSSDEGGSG